MSAAHNSVERERPARRENERRNAGREPKTRPRCIGSAFAIVVVWWAGLFGFAQNLQARTEDSGGLGSGVMGYWRGGIMEYWSNGVLGCWDVGRWWFCDAPSLQYPITPSVRQSNDPARALSNHTNSLRLPMKALQRLCPLAGLTACVCLAFFLA